MGRIIFKYKSLTYYKAILYDKLFFNRTFTKLINNQYQLFMKKNNRTRIIFFILIFTIVCFEACKNNDNPPNGNNSKSTEPPPQALGYSILKTYPHDTSSYTEGLEFYKGDLYEGTGNYDESRLLKLDLNTGKPVKELALNKDFFGEGITIINDTVYQLTYRENTAFVYTLKDFKKIKEFTFSTDTKEGWGMTNDGKNLIVTDGSTNLYFFNPKNFNLDKKLTITDGGNLTFNLNEVEYVDGFIYANQWQYNYIMKIDITTGKVVAKADCSELVRIAKEKNPSIDSFNGIAYNKSTGNFFVTGKYWPEIFEIQFSQ